jgi:hypothetical protein
MIPDFGESDVLHLNLPLKDILSTSLKSKTWPLWTPLLANGFPVLAEGQMGTFYLPNLLLFRFFPLVTAYNLNIVIAYFLNGIGMFLLLRKLKLKYYASLIGSIIYLFCGFFSVHLNHFNLLQAASLTPVVLYAALRLFHKSSMINLVFFSFLLSQQIFTGHFYIVFITLCAVLITYCFYSIFVRENEGVKNTFFRFGILGASCVLSLALSAIQLIPTMELMSLSSRRNGLDYDTVTSYPYPFKHLISFISPYYFGNPAHGTYPHFSANWGIFWENTAYIGIVPFFLALGSIFFLKDKRVRYAAVLVIVSFLLVLGKNSPMYFIFTFPFFNLFRVPSKYLLIMGIGIAVLFSFMVGKIKNRFFLLLIFAVSVYDVFSFSYGYPPLSSANNWIASPESVTLLKNQNVRKINTIGFGTAWNDIFLDSGWADMKPYIFLRNYLFQNYNAMFQIPVFSMNTGGLIPLRFSYLNRFANDFASDDRTGSATVSSLLKNTYSLYGISHILTPFRIDDVQFKIVATIPASPQIRSPLFIYQNNFEKSQIYFARKLKKVNTVEDVIRLWSAKDMVEDIPTLFEDDKLDIQLQPLNQKKLLVTSVSNTQIDIQTQTDKDALLVFIQTNYPGWHAAIDGVDQKIYTVNFTQMGIPLKAGTHRIKIEYKPVSFVWGKTATIAAHVIVFLMVFLSFARPVQTIFHTPQPSPDRERKSFD